MNPLSRTRLPWPEIHEDFFSVWLIHFCAILVFATGILVLIGWAAHIEVLKMGIPSSDSVKPIVAFFLIFSAIGLNLARNFSESRSINASNALKVIGGIFILLNAAILADYFIDTHFAFDQRVYALLDLSNVGTIAPNTAFSFLLLGLAFWNIGLRKNIKWSVIPAVLVGIIAYFALVGYLYASPNLYKLMHYTPMAFLTAISLFLIACALLFAQPRHAFSSMILGQTAGSEMLRKLLPGVLIIPALVGWLRLIGQERGWYPLEFGLAMHVVITTVILAGIVWRNGQHLYKLDVARQKTEKLMRHQALHDALTGLPNRKSLEDGFELLRSLVDRGSEKGMIAALFLDLDRFKTINDTLGHYIGDRILKEVAVRFSDAIGKKDVIARLGGDEFLILAEAESTQEVTLLANEVQHALRSVIQIDEYSLHVTTSIGIALYPQDGQDIYTLLKHADVALYRAKSAGRNRYQFYDFSMNVEMYEKLRLENDLRLAIRRQELELWFQPILDTDGNPKIIEALLRWRHPRLGLLEPFVFIPLAEETGLIIQIGDWVLREAMRYRKIWGSMGFHAPRIAVNLSNRQFSEFDLVDKFKMIIRDENFDPQLLQIEVTESTAMENIDRAHMKLNELNGLGIAISIDDFGKGYSSLSYLKRLPADCLKIDKSFIQHISSDPQDQTIVNAIIALGQNLGLEIVAEGVETKEQRDILLKMGCPLIQGFYGGEPLPATKFEEKWVSRDLKKQA